MFKAYEMVIASNGHMDYVQLGPNPNGTLALFYCVLILSALFTPVPWHSCSRPAKDDSDIPTPSSEVTVVVQVHLAGSVSTPPKLLLIFTVNFNLCSGCST
jgi:hypothetical protein